MFLPLLPFLIISSGSPSAAQAQALPTATPTAEGPVEPVSAGAETAATQVAAPTTAGEPTDGAPTAAVTQELLISTPTASEGETPTDPAALSPSESTVSPAAEAPIDTPAPEVVGSGGTVAAAEMVPGIPSGTARFGIIGDYAEGVDLLQVSNQIMSWSPDFVLTVGDNTYGDIWGETLDDDVGQYFHNFIYPYVGDYGQGATSNKFWPALGNHDWAVISEYLSYFTLPGNERYYEFARGPVDFFILDSDTHEPDGYRSTSVQAAWFHNAISASPYPWKLVLLHNPPYTSGSSFGSDTAVQWPFKSWGASAVFSGHNHVYERIVPPTQGILFFVDGLGGSDIGDFSSSQVAGEQFRYNGDFGAMRVDATMTSITFQFRDENGGLIDTASRSIPTISGNAGVAGATLDYTDLGAPQTATADASGHYSFTVGYNWSGTVTPSKSGYTFTPANRMYTNALANQSGQDYTAVEAVLPRAPTDFDGDHKTDPTKLIDAGAVWYQQSNASYAWASKYLGNDGTYIVNSDFDGDGKVDAAKYIPAGAIWYMQSGASDAWAGIYIGNDGTVVPTSDFDGDGKTDPAKFLADGSLWYMQSGSSYAWDSFFVGNDGTYIAGSDFDGDGKTDAAKLVGGSVWYYGSTDSGWHELVIGTGGTYVPRSDFDGDGKTDPAMLVGDTLYYLPSSGGGMQSFALGSDGTVVPGVDFDGDGKTDPAKIIPAGSLWYMQSGSGDAWASFYMGGDTYTIVN